MKKEKREGKKKKVVGDHSTHFVQAEKASSMDMCQRPTYRAFFFLQMDTHCEAEIGRVRKVCRPTCGGSPVTTLHLRHPPVLNQRGWCIHVGGLISVRTT